MNRLFLYIYVFLTGSAVMSIEMSASRLIAPYFGTSLMVWANIIGIILLAMSAGYLVGGRIADKHPTPTTLYGITIIPGLILTVVPTLSHLIFQNMVEGILSTPVITVLLSFAGILLVFAPPVFVLAMVSPFALRLCEPAACDTGKTAGRLYAVSTIGSLVGTFLPSFVLIPQIGTRSTIYASAFILLALAAWGFKRWWAFALAIIPLILLFTGSGAIKENTNILWEKETPYQYVQVVKQKDQSIALVYNEGGGVQSVARPNHELLAYDYYNYYLLLPFLRSQSTPEILVLGSAGGTMLNSFDFWVKPVLPKLSSTGVEIDPVVIPLGEKYFGLSGNEHMVNADARVYLNSQNDKVDYLFVDAYSHQIYIPFHLSTREFYKQAQAHLNQGGILAINVNAVSEDSALLQAFQKTLSSVFKYTYVLPVPDSMNYVLLATDAPLVIGAVPQNLPSVLIPFWQAAKKSLTPALNSTGMLLTDDKAPVEFLTDKMIWQTVLGTN